MGSSERLTKAHKWTIGAAVAVVFIGTILNLLVREWYSPDLRYEVNPYYKLSDQVVTSCSLKNYGRAPANEVRMSVEFLSKILDIQISPPSTGTVVEGGIGQSNATITLDVLVPKEQATIFFALEREQQDEFIGHIRSKEVLGHTGPPILRSVFASIAILIAALAIVSILGAWLLQGLPRFIQELSAKTKKEKELAEKVEKEG